MTSIPGKRQFARGHVSVAEDGHRQVALVGGHGSHLLGELARANALVILPEDTDLVGNGEEVSVWMLATSRSTDTALDASVRAETDRPAAPQSGRRGADGRRLGEGRHGADRDCGGIRPAQRGVRGGPARPVRAKGDALAVARIAGIQGAKRTPDLIPLCHPLSISGVDVGAEVSTTVW